MYIQLMNFILQNPPYSAMEKGAVRMACALRDEFRIVPASEGTRADCPVGTVEFCTQWMRAWNIPIPEPIDYPECLRDALCRRITLKPLGEVRPGQWIKPYKTKAWDAKIVTLQDMQEGRDLTELVWETQPIPSEHWVAEWRVYVVEGRIVGEGRYDDGPDDFAAFDADLVQTWVDIYTASGEAPAGYALDVARLSDGRTILVEVTDGWAIGIYKGTCSPVDYARLLAVRWGEIAGQARK